MARFVSKLKTVVTDNMMESDRDWIIQQTPSTKLFISETKSEHPVLLRLDSGLWVIAHPLQREEFCFQPVAYSLTNCLLPLSRLTAQLRMCHPRKINTATSEETMSFTQPWQHWAARSKKLEGDLKTSNCNVTTLLNQFTAFSISLETKPKTSLPLDHRIYIDYHTFF